MSNYATKPNLNAAGVDTSKFAKKIYLANLKPNVDKLDIDKLKKVRSNLSNLKSEVDKVDVDKLVPVPLDLSKLSYVVKNDVLKKYVYNAMIKNIKDKLPDITNLAANASQNAKINNVKGEIPSITNLATTAALNVEINEVKGEIPNTTNLASTTALADVENEIPNVRNLVKKTDCNTKINETGKEITDHDQSNKYIATQEFNELTAEKFSAWLKQANLLSKSNIANFVKRTDFNKKLKANTSNKNEFNELSKNVKAISTKRLTKYLISLIFLMEQNLFLLKYCKTI